LKKHEESKTTLINIEADWSSASYWYSVCALSAGSEIRLRHFRSHSPQSDAVLPEIYSRLGVRTSWKKNELVLKNDQGELNFFKYDFRNCPDIAITVAATCIGLGCPAHISGLQTLPLKESNRIIAFASEAKKLGAEVEAGKDFLKVRGAPKAAQTKLLAHNDHRIAMSFAPLALKAGP